MIARAPHHQSFQQSSLKITQTGSIQNFQPKILPNHPARVHLDFFWPKLLPNHPAGVHSKSPRKTSSDTPSSHPFTRLMKILIQIPQKHAYQKPIPTELPSTHPTYHPLFIPIRKFSACPTPTPSHTWDIPGYLGVHMGHNVLAIKVRYHFLVQSWMQLCI